MSFFKEEINSNVLYGLDSTNIDYLMEYLLGNGFPTEITNIFSNRTDGIISLRIYPFNIDSLENVGDKIPIVVGGAELVVNTSPITHVEGRRLTGYVQPFIEYELNNWGNVLFNNFLDKNNYTSVFIHLPFLGFKELDMSVLLSLSKVVVRYNIDFYSGESMITIGDGDIVKYYFSTQIGMDLPIGSNNIGEITRNTLIKSISAIGGVALSVATSNPAPLIASASTALMPVQQSTDVTVPNGITGARELPNNDNGGVNVGFRRISRGDSSERAIGLMTQTKKLYATTNISPSCWLMEDPTVYLLFEQPIPNVPANYNHLYGRPCDKVLILGDITGYTEVTAVHLENIPNAIEMELSEIEELLKSGIIL